jgi:hypothetical protein
MENKIVTNSFIKSFILASAAILMLSGCSLGFNDTGANLNDVEKVFVEETRSLNTSVIRNAPGLNQEGPDNIVKNYTDEELVAEGYRLCESFAIGATLKDIIVGSVDANTQYANTAIGLGAAYHLCPSYKYLADEFVNG